MELEEAWIFGMWPKRLLIFEDRMETRDFELLREKAEPRRYGQVRAVTVSGEGPLANLLITVQDGDPILVRGLSQEVADRARALIEERVARTGGQRPRAPSDRERLMQDLAELRDAGVLTNEEFETKRREVSERSRDER